MKKEGKEKERNLQQKGWKEMSVKENWSVVRGQEATSTSTPRHQRHRQEIQIRRKQESFPALASSTSKI